MRGRYGLPEQKASALAALRLLSCRQLFPHPLHERQTVYAWRPTQTVPRMVAAFKRMTNSAAGTELWQTSYYDHGVRGENDFLRIWSYIDNNPARWAEDEYFS